MISKKAFITALLGCTILAGCDGSNDNAQTTEATPAATFPATPSDSAAGTPATTATPVDIAPGATQADLATAQAKIAELQTALNALDQVTKVLKLDSIQPHIAALQNELTSTEPITAKLAGVSANAGVSRVRTEKFDKTSMSAEDTAALADLLAQLGTVATDISAKQADLAATLSKGDGLIKNIQALPVDATSADVAAVDSDITALTQSLKNDRPTLQASVVDLDKRTKAIKGKISDLTGLFLADYVNTMRGAQSSGDFTRGNTFPATAMPFGFNFWTPVNRDDKNWFYQFKTSETGSAINTISSFSVVHEPSPWIGNRQSLSIMPVSKLSSSGEPETRRSSRVETFQRQNETATSYYYSLTFDNGVRTEITPTDHAAYFRFTAPATQSTLAVVVSAFNGISSTQTVDQANGVVTGSTSESIPMYYYIKFDKPVTQSKASGSDAWVRIATPDGDKVVGMRIATSFLSVDQAKANLDDEIGSRTFDNIKDLAEQAWQQKLGAIRVKGATEDQKTILYSNMYRSFLYPNSAWEKEKDTGKAVYMSPYTSPTTKKEGKIWVNNGFWDTYRTTWPLYDLLIPTQAGQMIDGFINGYKDGGWVTRWSGPGYNDSMVATSSDIIFADAYMKGVRNFDVESAYASMMKNATTYSNQGDRGRKGMDQSVFYGYAAIGEAVAWTLEANLNDFGVAQMAQALEKNDDYPYFANRAISYGNIFDATSTGSWAGGWFRGRNTSGGWKGQNSSPSVWGYDYTEGNAWSYAFLAPQDGQGLANLYGGRDKLKAKLDAFFTAAPSTLGYPDYGSYNFAIHEMKEAQTAAQLAGVGQYQHSNQPVHHSIYMYNYAGTPANGQKYLRDVMDKLYFSGVDKDGNSTGEGYIGDEDNGEQSAWYVLSAMGIYPVSVGRPEYAIGAPYFPEMTVTLESGKKIAINAPNVSSANRYVQSVKLNGKDVTKNYLLHADLVAGATLDFVMGPNQSQWGTGINDVPTSITEGSARPAPLSSLLPPKLYNVTASETAAMANLFDRTSNTEWSQASGTAGWVQAEKKDASTKLDSVQIYTLTSSNGTGKDPTGWTLKGSNDGTNWTTLDTRTDQTFQWRRQTRPFALKKNASGKYPAFAKYRIEFSGTADTAIAEFELLGVADDTQATAGL